MIAFPNCKINLGLNIIHKRKDGYHDLETVFLPLPFTDVLEILPSDKTEFTCTGLPVDATGNLCIKAYELLKKDFPSLLHVKMHLHKVISLGAGLGGGSADASFTLNILNEKFKLNLTPDQLIDYALKLGSDCPFFIINKPCIATGRGEILQPINIDLSPYKIVIVNPGIHIDTRLAFTNVNPHQPEFSIQEILQQPIESWKDQLQNDFEETAFALYPQLKVIKKNLYDKGALYASMTGSGSTIYGIFMKEKKIQNTFPNNFFYKVVEL